MGWGSQGALGLPQADIPREGKATGTEQPAKHQCFITEAASTMQGAGAPPLHQAGVLADPTAKGLRHHAGGVAEVRWDMLAGREEG